MVHENRLGRIMTPTRNSTSYVRVHHLRRHASRKADLKRGRRVCDPKRRLVFVEAPSTSQLGLN